ncbi:MAG TPA: substrate-binding domain-containing protein [Bacteroidales bacterium]|nr:substrate-binding domain-containing protein [Bacteroidales bacterium]HQK72105.1 substrate-binding domain-containing protein [Bacteroidales bacterium]
MTIKKSKRVSLKDIADRVGVSTALVSYVLNGQEKEKRVGAEVVIKIRKALKEMNYKPHHIARSLRYGTTQTIGLIVADIANPFFGSMARFIEDEATKAGYTLIIGSSDESCTKTDTLVNTLMNRQVDGFILVPAEGCTEFVQNLLNEKIPVVLVDRYIPEVSTSYVVLDNYAATYDATNYLVTKGYQKIGMIAYKSSLIHMKDRIRGYEDAMKANGLGKNVWVKYIKYKNLESDMSRVITSISGKGGSKIDALFFATNTLSIAGLYKIRDLQLKVPEDLALIGFDGNEAFDFFYSPLTYVEQPVGEMSKEAVRILLDQMAGSEKISSIRLRANLITRDSC